MRILIWCQVFHPIVGGMQTRTITLANEFVRQGHQVRVLTLTRSEGEDDFPFEVLRRPSPVQLWNSVEWCDVFYHSHFAVRPAWPLLLLPRRWVVGVHVSLRGANGKIPRWRRLKLACIRLAARIIVPSRAIADELPGYDVSVIPNPYRDDLFYRLSDVERTVELIFVGRLERIKGPDVLLNALVELRAKGLKPQLWIVGSGPMEAELRRRVEDLGLQDQVTFAGERSRQQLSQLYNRAKVQVIPSVCNEAFGIVALEGIACGCAIVASHAGGLPDAVGRCGLTFPKSDARALADCLYRLLTDAVAAAECRAYAEDHLRQHRPATVAASYLDVFAIPDIPARTAASGSVQ